MIILEFKSEIHSNCFICKNQIFENPVSIHDGRCKSFHIECLKTQLKIKNLCPKCHEPVNLSLFFSWKERSLIQINLAKHTATNVGVCVAKVVARVGMKAGIILGTSVVILPAIYDKMEGGMVGIVRAGFDLFLVIFVASMVGAYTRDILTDEESSIRAVVAAEAVGFGSVLLITGIGLVGIDGVAKIFASAAAGAALEGAFKALFAAHHNTAVLENRER